MGVVRLTAGRHEGQHGAAFQPHQCLGEPIEGECERASDRTAGKCDQPLRPGGEGKLTSRPQHFSRCPEEAAAAAAAEAAAAAARGPQWRARVDLRAPGRARCQCAVTEATGADFSHARGCHPSLFQRLLT
jgi:hypothetical protein